MSKEDNEQNQQPVTKADFQEAMQMIASAFEKVATKDDLIALEQRMDNKLTASEERMNDKLTASEERMNDKLTASEERMKENLKETEERISHEFNAVAENIHLDVAGANKDEISLIDDKQKQHEARLEVIEKRLQIS